MLMVLSVCSDPPFCPPGHQESVPRVLVQSSKISRESQQEQIPRRQSMWVNICRKSKLFTVGSLSESLTVPIILQPMCSSCSRSQQSQAGEHRK